MHVILVCAGRRGDVEPFVALGLNLIEAGARVTIVGPADQEKFVTTHMKGLHAFYGESFGGASEMEKFVVHRMQHFGKEVPPEEDAEFMELVTTRAVSQAEGIDGRLDTLRQVTDRLTGPCAIVYHFFWIPEIMTVVDFRAKSNLPPLPMYRMDLVPTIPSLHIPTVVKGEIFAPDHPPVADMILEHQKVMLGEYGMHPLLKTKLDSVREKWGLGPVQEVSPQLRSATTSKCACHCACRGWFTLRPEHVAPGRKVPASIHFAGPTPHTWLMPKCAASVIHGGVGTTGAALQAAKPVLVVPFFADQPFWGWHMYNIEVGPAPIPVMVLTSTLLASRLKQLVEDGKMAEKAALIGPQIKTERGVKKAVEVIMNSKVEVAAGGEN